MIVEATAPAKVILIGEHFVVENEPAIVTAVDLRAKVRVKTNNSGLIRIFSKNYNSSITFKSHKTTEIEKKSIKIFRPFIKIIEELDKEFKRELGLNIEIDSEIPPESGMGSSAAVSVATSAALLKALGLKYSVNEILNLSLEAEKIVHGKPSGIDNTISTYGGTIIYRRNEGFLPLESNFSDIDIIVADTGIPRNTGELVKKVRILKNKYPKVFEPLYHTAGRLAIEAAKALRNEDFESFGELMNINHGLLSAIGVSLYELEQLVYTARRNGALGAKITGAGGGGAIVALSYRERSNEIAKNLMRVAKKVYILKPSSKGVGVVVKDDEV